MKKKKNNSYTSYFFWQPVKSRFKIFLCLKWSQCIPKSHALFDLFCLNFIDSQCRLMCMIETNHHPATVRLFFFYFSVGRREREALTGLVTSLFVRTPC